MFNRDPQGVDLFSTGVDDLRSTEGRYSIKKRNKE